jgi:hypothetical protein
MSIRTLRFAVAAAVLLFAAHLQAQAAAVDVRLVVEPPQTVNAIVLRGADGDVRALPVNAGRISVPRDLPMPWTLGLKRFAEVVYGEADLTAGRPLRLREMGSVTASLAAGRGVTIQSPTLLLLDADAKTASNHPLPLDDARRFSVSVPPGIYEGVVVSSGCATRIRKGIVVPPGAMIDLGALECQATTRVALQIRDKQKGTPISGARISWSPPDALNSPSSALLYSSVWSAVSDRNGRAIISGVGPTPIALQWRVAADGYASTLTGRVAANSPDAGTNVETYLRRNGTLAVRVKLPPALTSLRNATLRLGERDDNERSKSRQSKPLINGVTQFSVTEYGRKRIWAETSTGQKLCYLDISVETDAQQLDFAPVLVALEGRITRGGEPVSKATIRVADRHDPGFTLSRAQSGDDGIYASEWYDSGTMLVTVNRGYSAGRDLGHISDTITPSGAAFIHRDFELPDRGLIIDVEDSATGEPVPAKVDRTLELKDGTWMLGHNIETDANGRLVVSGAGEGTAHLRITADFYDAVDIDIPLRENPEPKTVKLTRASPVRGRVVDLTGHPVANAQVSGGYVDPPGVQPGYVAFSGADGQFEFRSPPPAGSLAYVVASRHALGLVSLRNDREITVVLSNPSPGHLTLLPDGGRPDKINLLAAAAAGENMIPYGVLIDLAESNGLTDYALLGTAPDGGTLLPQFLPPGIFDLYIAMPSSAGFSYRKIATITTPLKGNPVMAFERE